MTRSIHVHAHLDPWRTLVSEYPAAADLASRLRFLLNYASLAPSAFNSQPWRFRVSHSAVDLYADRSRSRLTADPDGRELIISCGAALLHFRLAVRYFGLTYELHPTPDPSDPDHLAHLVITGQQPPSGSETSLFQAIPSRHTHRGSFRAGLLSPGLTRRLREAAAGEGAHLQCIPPGALQGRLLRLAIEAEREHWQDPVYCREWASWLRTDSSAVADGLPASVLGFSPALLPWMPLVMRTLPVGFAPGQTANTEALQAPMIACLETAGDSIHDWLQAGQALARLLLVGSSEAVLASYLNHPIQIQARRRELATILHTSRAPQTLLRLGYAESKSPTPRLTIGEFADKAYSGAERAEAETP